jgi:hypothetical protein
MVHTNAVVLEMGITNRIFGSDIRTLPGPIGKLLCHISERLLCGRDAAVPGPGRVRIRAAEGRQPRAAIGCRAASMTSGIIGALLNTTRPEVFLQHHGRVTVGCAGFKANTSSSQSLGIYI